MVANQSYSFITPDEYLEKEAASPIDFYTTLEEIYEDVEIGEAIAKIQ